MIDVESHERAVELAAYVSSEPGPRHEIAGFGSGPSVVTGAASGPP